MLRPGQLVVLAADLDDVRDVPQDTGPTPAPVLRWGMEHLDALLGGSPRLLVDRSARIEFANPAARGLLALGDDRRTLIDIVAPEHLAPVLQRLAATSADAWHETIEFRSGSGERIAAEVRAVGRVDGVWVLAVEAIDANASEAVLLEVASGLLEAMQHRDRAASEEIIHSSLGRFADRLGVDRAAVFVYDNRAPLESVQSVLWARPGSEHRLVLGRWWLRRLERNARDGSEATPPRVVYRVDDCARDPDAEKWRRMNVSSTMAVHALVGSHWNVAIAVSMTGQPREWSDREQQILQSAAAMFGNAVRCAQSLAEARANHDALVASEARFRSTIMDAPAIIFRVGRTTEVLLANREAARYGEVPPEALLGQRLVDHISDEMAQSLQRDVDHVFATGEDVDSVVCLPTPRLGEVWLDCRGVPERGPSGEIESMLLFAIDVTARRSMEEQIRQSADVDALTGLTNRRAALERLDALLTATDDDEPVAVLFIDLDRFKLTNDSLGHAAGDAVLQAVARSLQSCATDGDVMCRLGGDEFAIVLPHAGNVVDLVRRVERVRNAIATPIDIGTQLVTVTASIGVAVSGTADVEPESLLRLADVAMYQAKTLGRNRFEIFDENLRSEIDARLDIETALRKALPERQLEVHYQPEVMLADGRLVGVEALVRWRHPERGLLAAGTFIDVAEESALISDIGRFVVSEACRQVGEWSRAYPDLPLKLRVNVSGRQLIHTSLLRDVTIALADSRLPPERLCLEITETALMSDIDTSIQMMRWIRELGVDLAIDDFGTGYSSLGYLERFPVDTLKIDRSFVVGLGHDPKASAIVRTLVSLAQVLDLDVVAEGVETSEQVTALQELGCETAQGFLYAPALPAGEIEPLLRQGFVPPKLS